jgi:hypothetical protein
MKKKCRLIGLVALLLMAMAVLPAGANDYRQLSISEMARFGATHAWTLTYKDFAASTSTNTALAITNVVAANTAVFFKGMVLNDAFSVETTNYTGSCALIVGNGTDTDLFLASTELASDGSEVYVKYGPPNTYAVTSASASITNILGVTNVTAATVVTNVTAAVTGTILGHVLYSSAGVIVATFTPNTEEALSQNVKGQVTLYLQLITVAK